MGQYYLVVNIDKQEYLNPHRLNDGAKLMEFACSQDGTMTALAILLADGNGRGGGDCRSQNTEYIGRWAGDRIVITGDYADEGKFTAGLNDKNLYKWAHDTFEDISIHLVGIMKEDAES